MDNEGKKAINRKTPGHGYRVSEGSRLSFQGRWYVCPGLLSRLSGREFEVYYDRRDISVLYLFVDGTYLGEAYCTQFMGGRVSEWEARAMRKYDEEQEALARTQGQQTRARIQEEAGRGRKRRNAEIRQVERGRQWDRQREEIHPAEVLERLASIEEKKPAVTCPKNNDDEQALGDQLFTALGVKLPGHWRTRKPKLMGHLHQYGTKLIVVDDAHDLSLQHLMFLKEVTDQGRLQYNHRLGLCLVAAGRGNTIPLKEILDQPETMWLQFRRRMDKLEPFCRIAGHTSEEVREILAALEIAYRELFPQLNLRQWSGIIYTWLTQSLLDPTNSGRVTMDNLSVPGQNMHASRPETVTILFQTVWKPRGMSKVQGCEEKQQRWESVLHREKASRQADVSRPRQMQEKRDGLVLQRHCPEHSSGALLFLWRPRSHQKSGTRHCFTL
jgi:hypothetical protein